MNKKRLFSLAIAAIVVAGLVGYALVHPTQPANNKLRITASFYPLYEFAKNIAGNNAAVTNITPAGSEPHDFEPSPQQLVTAQTSDVFIYNGGTMEPWTTNFLLDYKHTAVKGSAGIALLTNDEGQDPHYWLDPILAQQTVNDIRDSLIKIDPAHTDDYNKNAANYNGALDQLNTDLTNGLATCRTRTIVTSHAAFSYYAKRYNLDVVSIAGLSPDQEPSAAKLTEVSTLVRQKGIRDIFFESLVSPRLAATIATETGAKTAVFDPIEGITNEAQSKGKTYLTLQRDNLAALRTALACQ